MKKFLIASLVLALPALLAIPQRQPSPESTLAPLSFGIRPLYSFPSPWDQHSDSFDFGAGARLEAEYILPFARSFYAAADIGYDFSQLSTRSSLSILSLAAGFGYRLPLLDWLELRASLSGGGYYGFVNSSGHGGGGFLLGAEPSLGFRLGPSIRLRLGLGYRLAASFLQTIDLGLGLSYVPATAARSKAIPQPRLEPLVGSQGTSAPSSGAGLSIESLTLGDVFPIFHTYYDSNSIGKLTLKNDGSLPATGIVVSLFIRQYMDLPKECAKIAELKPGESRTVELYALFKNEILEVTENTKVSAEATVGYDQGGASSKLSRGETLRVYKRNAMTWDDDRKAASFVTANDLAVLTFSNNVNAILKGKLNRALDKNLQTAIALHDALRLYGISYVSNPLAAYAEVSKDKKAVDTLKFPRETFAYKSGDCSDLSILYCALLESVQVETAFITIPGHIFMAFSLKMGPAEARSSFARSDELIFRNDKAWVPIEVTEREKTFLDAWQTGAKEWRENLSRDLAAFYPVREAWASYEAVGLPGTSSAPVLPDPVRILQDFRADVGRHVQSQIYAKVAELQAAIAKSQNSPKAVNALGVLYARYDLVDQAVGQFQGAVKREEFVPALVNLGNLAFLGGDFEKALSYYERACKKSPKDPNALLGMARASQELEDYRTVKKAYEELKQAAPALAQQFAYLELRGEESTRAAEISGAKETMVWAEE
jgi:tetratricopeptide (TPR) repeat protein